MTYKGFDNAAFQRQSNTTLAKHIRQLEEAQLRKFQFWALLQANGQTMYNQSGAGMDWPVQFDVHAIEGNMGETQRNFTRSDLYKVANLEYRGYQATDTMFEKEFRANRGPEGIVKVFDRMTSTLEQSLLQGLGPQFYIDGTAAGNEEMWHGLKSMFGGSLTNDQTITYTAGSTTPRAANVADPVGYPVDNYAGLDCTLGNYGGDQETAAVWPEGVADASFDFWSPIIVNYTSNVFAGGGTAWSTNALDAMRYGFDHTNRNQVGGGDISNVFIWRDGYRQFKSLVDDSERIVVSSENSLRALGFRDVIVLDGVEISKENALPSAEGYGFNWECVEMRCMFDDLFKVEGPEYDIHSQGYNAVVSTLSNLKFDSPRNFFCLAAMA